jgi:hypothetical protein
MERNEAPAAVGRDGAQWSDQVVMERNEAPAAVGRDGAQWSDQ